MTPIDVKSYAPEIGQLVLRKSITMLPLQWHIWPDRSSMARLTSTKLHDLFSPKPVANEEAARCVFAGLSFLCGSGAAVEKVCKSSPSKEALYWRAIACRKAAQADQAKAMFHQVDGHAIYDELSRGALELIGLGSDKQLGTISEIVKQTGTWEPRAFTDLFEQARTGKVSDLAVKTTCQIQQLEVQLPLKHCHDAAIGAAVCSA